MYTVGQVAKFLGVSRDTLKFYEDKELLYPKHRDENGYRSYDVFDMNDVITINFYRELELEIKRIQEIRKSKSVNDIRSMLVDKEKQILEEINFKQQLLKRIEAVKEDCDKINEHLGRFTIKEMKPILVKDEITNLNAYDEYEVIQKHTEHSKKAITYTNLNRVIQFNEQGIVKDKFIIVKKLDESEIEKVKGEVLYHPKCLYTVIENGRYINGGQNIDHEVEASLRKLAVEYGYELLGLTYVNILLTTYENGLERIFLEIYTPIK